MPLYSIKKLHTWCGDSASQSYDYFVVGYTRSEELVSQLRKKKLKNTILSELQDRPWVEFGMEGKNIYNCEILKVSTLVDLKNFNDIPEVE